jgi:hypothetical protein
MGALNWCLEISVIAGPMLANETRESWLNRAARKAGIAYRQAKALYYGETDDPKVSVAYNVLKAAATARREAMERAERLENHAAKLNAKIKALDPNLVSEHVVSASNELVDLINQARMLRDFNST